MTYTNNQWHHILVEIKSNHGLASSILLNNGVSQGGTLHCGGKIDDVRIFNAPLSTSQIADLAAGNNGSGGTVTPYDVASSNSTLSGQTYTSSTQSTNTWAASKAFDTIWSNHKVYDGIQTLIYIVHIIILVANLQEVITANGYKLI